MSTYFKKVMIIDDNKIDRWLLKKNISRTDLAEEIIEVETGIEALNLLTATAEEHLKFPDIIFLDMQMPVLSGLEFLDAFNELIDGNEINCRIVIACSVEDPVEKKKVFKYNFVIGYYQKPLSEPALLELKELVRQPSAS